MLKRPLAPGLTLYRDRRFPARRHAARHHRYRTVVGIGGNVGDVRRRFHRLAVALERDRRVALLQSGPILKNPPFGFLEQADFYNSVLELSTSMQPRPFLRYLLHLEQRFGRKRPFPNAPRTLDLDILFFDGRRINRADLQVPHPHWNERSSVVIPLAWMGAHR